MFSEFKILLLCFFFQKVSAESIFVKLDGGATNQFDNVTIIGEGSNGVVYQGEWVEENKKVVAIKTALSEKADIEIKTEASFYKHIGVLGGDPNSEEYQKAIAAGILEVYACGIVTTIDEIVEDEDEPEFLDRKVLIMELVGLNLFEATTEDDNKTRVNLSPSKWLQIGLEMLRALQFLHFMKIIHGDVKPDNFALRDGKSLCILDFGSARMITEKFGGIKGSPYFHSFLLTNRFIQLFKWLPGDIAPLLRDPGMVEDLESCVMSIYDIKIEVDWYAYQETFSLYYDVSYSTSSTPIAKMEERELEAFNMNQNKRDNVMKNALLNMLNTKRDFPDQIQTNLKRVLEQTPHLEKIKDTIELFREIVLYARSKLSEGSSETMEENVTKEDEFVKRCTVILKNWENTSIVEKSTQKSEMKVIEPVDVFVNA